LKTGKSFTKKSDGAENSKGSLATGDMLKFGQTYTGVGFLTFIISIYLMKYTTDVLGMAPALIGSILALTRIWDAVSDPLVGALSDQTKSKMGRRRPWILASCIPLAIAFVMIWSPPAGLTGTSLTTWMSVAIIAYFTATTILNIPLASWGAELSESYTERTKLFGFRHGFFTTGSFLAVVVLYLMSTTDDQRGLMFLISLIVAAVLIVSILTTVFTLKERSGYQAASETNPWRSYLNVAKNKYARRFMFVYFLSMFSLTVSGVFTPYISQYILGGEKIGALLLMLYLVTSVAVIPIWVRISRSISKNKMWFIALLILGTAFAAAYSFSAGAMWNTYLVYILFGFGGSCLMVVSPSIQTDVIDYGECLSGKRSEGTYYAAFYFLEKLSTAGAVFFAGIVLQFADFVPNQAQTDETKMWLLVGFSVIPTLFYVLAALFATRFDMDKKKYGQIRRVLTRRREQSVT